MLTLPQGYQFLGPQETQALLKRMGNFPSGSELGLITATGDGEQWFMVVRYIDAGYVKDEEAAEWDADALMASIKEGTDEDNKQRQVREKLHLEGKAWSASRKAAGAVLRHDPAITDYVAVYQRPIDPPGGELADVLADLWR